MMEFCCFSDAHQKKNFLEGGIWTADSSSQALTILNFEGMDVQAKRPTVISCPKTYFTLLNSPLFESFRDIQIAGLAIAVCVEIGDLCHHIAPYLAALCRVARNAIAAL